ncbi:MAG: BTAD domain-containing putative transcriptional regulator [Actinomycetota bacterium]
MLGPVAVVVDGDGVPIPSGVPTRLLAVLVAAGGRFVSIDSLRERLWSDGRPRSRATVHSHVRRLRDALDPHGSIVESGGDRGYRLAAQSIDVDADEFRRGVATAQAAVGAEEWETARSTLSDVLQLWRSDRPLPELDEDLDARPWVAELLELRDWAERQVADLAIRAGDVAEVIPQMEGRLADDPTDQRAVATLMRAYATSGRPERAAAVYDDLVRRLGQELGEVPLPELVELDGRILRHDPALVGLGERHQEVRPAPVPASQSPAFGAPLTSFIGRRGELERLLRLVDEGRLVSVVGPGGAGKTRLVHELGRRVQRPGGVFLAQLASCAEGDLAAVIERVAQAVLGAEPQRIDAPTRLVGALDAVVDEPTLLVLDNCEHVLEPVALLTVMLLEAMPGLQLVLTTREALQVPGERRLVLAPLPLAPVVFDPLTELDDVATGEPSDSARLFLDRAEAAGWERSATAEELRAVERICRHVGGLPLGIELVAPMLGFHEVDDLERRVAAMPFLGEVRSPHVRQRSIEEVVSWSVTRLGPDERRLVLVAGAFAGPFTRDVLLAVAARVWPETASWQWASAFDGIVARSLVTVAGGAAGMRYRLVEPVRAFARRLAREEEISVALGSAHAEWFAGFARDSVDAASARGLGMPLSSDDWVLDLADVRAALLWSVEHGADELGLALLDAVGLRVYGLALTPQVLAWLDRLADDPQFAAVALDLLITHAMFAGELEQLERLTARTLGALDTEADGARRGRALVVAAFAHVLAGRYGEAGAHLADARDALVELDDPWLVAWADAVDGLLLRREQRWAESEAACNRAIGAFEALNDRQGRVLPVLTLGRLAAATGDPKRGLELLDDGIAESVRLGERLLVATGSAYAAMVHAQIGELAEATTRLAVVLRVLRGTPHRVLLANAIEQVAVAAALAGMPEEAARLVGFSEAHRPVPRPHELPLLDELAGSLGERRMSTLAREGAGLPADRAIDEALVCLGAVATAVAE